MPVTMDPWSGKFGNFVAAFKHTQAGTMPPEFSMFTVDQLQSLMQLPGADRIVFYTVDTPGRANSRMMLAIAVDTDGKRLGPAGTPPGTLNPPYVWSMHNCPPDCDADPVWNEVNLWKNYP